MTYDNRTYAVVAQVTDKGDGTLAVQWQIADSDGNAVKAMAFENTYAAVPTAVQFGVGKLLDGRARVKASSGSVCVEPMNPPRCRLRQLTVCRR